MRKKFKFKVKGYVRINYCGNRVEQILAIYDEPLYRVARVKLSTYQKGDGNHWYELRYLTPIADKATYIFEALKQEML